MHIMLVISSLRRGGAERVVSIMANYWAAKGHDIFLTTIEGEEADAYTVNSGVQRIALGLARVSRNPWRGVWSNLRRIWHLRAVVCRVRPDVVVSFMTHTNLLTLLALFGSRIPVIVSERVDPAHMGLGKVREKLRVWLYPRTAAVVVQTVRVKEAMQRVLPEVDFVVIPNPVPDTDPDEGRAHIGLRELVRLPLDAKVVVAMGRLDPQKGFDLLVEAFARLSNQYLGWHLVIFGEGAARSELQSQVSRLGLAAQVHLPGLVWAARRYLAEVDLFVLSSRYEGFPNVLLEAMACSRPVISFDCPSGPAEIIRDGYDGLLVDGGDVKSLADAMSVLMESSVRRKELGANAHQVLDRFSVDGVMALWDGLLASAVLPGIATATSGRGM